jgi:excisionase family DNA binding protein
VTPILHTVDEAAELLACKPSWLKEKARRREIPFTLVGGSYRFSDEHIAQIVDQFEVAPRPRSSTSPVRAPRRKKSATAPKPNVVQLQSRPSRRLRNAS